MFPLPSFQACLELRKGWVDSRAIFPSEGAGGACRKAAEDSHQTKAGVCSPFPGEVDSRNRVESTLLSLTLSSFDTSLPSTLFCDTRHPILQTAWKEGSLSRARSAPVLDRIEGEDGSWDPLERQLTQVSPAATGRVDRDHSPGNRLVVRAKTQRRLHQHQLHIARFNAVTPIQLWVCRGHGAHLFGAADPRTALVLHSDSCGRGRCPNDPG